MHIYENASVGFNLTKRFKATDEDYYDYQALVYHMSSCGSLHCGTDEDIPFRIRHVMEPDWDQPRAEVYLTGSLNYEETSEYKVGDGFN